LNNAPKTPEQIEAARIGREAIRKFISEVLLYRAREGEVERRVRYAAKALGCDPECASNNELAEKLQISRQRSYLAVDNFRVKIAEICRKLR
jgi:hypothetical protein